MAIMCVHAEVLVTSLLNVEYITPNSEHRKDALTEFVMDGKLISFTLYITLT